MGLPFNIFRKKRAQASDVCVGDVCYTLGFLAGEVEGVCARVLCVGYGNPLKACVQAARDAGIRQLFATGTRDKARGFSFGGAATVIELANKFDARLFANDFALLGAVDASRANVVLWAQKEPPSATFRTACARVGVLLLVPCASGTGAVDDRPERRWDALAEADVSDLPRAIYTQERLARAVDVCEWKRCRHCKSTHAAHVLQARDWACPTCGELVALNGRERIALVFDPGTFTEMFCDISQLNALNFEGFDAAIARAQEKSGVDEGVTCGTARLFGMQVAVAVMESDFMMGSMGHVVGEKLARTFEHATAKRLPVVVFCASGGARMQEGLSSLMQMAKVSAAVEAHSAAGLLYISVICDPTTGGVSASFAALGDIILAEPHATYGFAGRRVIQNTIKQALPDDFQTAEFALDRGLVDAIIARPDLRDTLAKLISLHQNNTHGEGEGEGGGTESAPIPTRGASAAQTLRVYSTVHESAFPQGERVGVQDANTPAPEYPEALGTNILREAQIIRPHVDPPDASQPAHPEGRVLHEETGKPEGSARAARVGTALRTSPAPSTLSDASQPVHPEGRVSREETGKPEGSVRAARVGTALRTSPAPSTSVNASQPAHPEGRVLHEESGLPEGSARAARVGAALRIKPPTFTGQNLSAWDRVKIARDPKRPTAAFYIASVFDDFVELHGDRAGADDAGIIAGIGKIAGRAVTVVAQEKGADLKDRIRRNFGCTQASGYHKARRLMAQAQKFGRPVVCLVDTQGAFCGKSAEEAGIGGAIAQNLAFMSALTVPVVSVVIGEGGSGGALGLAVANRVAMQENAVYSILSPEGFASILWKDAARAPDAAHAMKMSAQDALALGFADEIIGEGEGGAAQNAPEAAANLHAYLSRTLDELSTYTGDGLAKMRYERFRKY